jgi:hypothetical protein
MKASAHPEGISAAIRSSAELTACTIQMLTGPVNGKYNKIVDNVPEKARELNHGWRRRQQKQSLEGMTFEGVGAEG